MASLKSSITRGDKNHLCALQFLSSENKKQIFLQKITSPFKKLEKAVSVLGMVFRKTVCQFCTEQ